MPRAGLGINEFRGEIPICERFEQVETATIDDVRQVVAFEPWQHPDFVECDDPRWGGSRAMPTVYVPSLVYLVNRLGGLANIAESTTCGI
jgi:hypothetical protein